MAGDLVLVIDDSPTILKVVQLVLTKAGYTVLTATDGDEGILQAKEHRPDVILLDFVMPKMNGYQVCQTLHQDEDLTDIPVILMSAKGDQVGERFVKVMGIVDYITKPFSPEAITGVVQHTVAKYKKSEKDEEDLTPDIQFTPEEATAAAEASLEARRTALDTFRDGFAKAAGELLAGVEEGNPEQIKQEICQGLSHEKLEILLGELRASAPELIGDTNVALAGDLNVVPLAEVLQLLGEQEQYGVLVVTRGNAQVELHFKQGKIDLGQAVGVPEELLLGRFIVEAEAMSQVDLDLVVQNREQTQLLGTQLVAEKLITVEDLRDALRQQTREQVYEVLRWKFGKFSFRASRDPSAMAEEASLGLEVDVILMEGFRRVDEWHLIEREIDNFDQVYLRNEDAVTHMGRGQLTREELAVLELVNGKNTIKEIIRQSRMGSFEVSKMLFRLLSIKLIRKRVQPTAV